MDIQNSPAGNVVKFPSGYRAFIPNNLPPKIEWDNSVINSLSRADYLLGKLAREGSKLPNPHLLIRPFVAREAVLSSKIEGTQTTLDDILSDDAGSRTNQDPNDLEEVRNYIKALDYGISRLSEMPLSLRLIREIHQKLMNGVRGAHATPGEFRRSQNWIGTPGCTLNTAKFVPPPAENLAECLGEFEKFMHDRSLPPLIHIALCHYQFEAIHPFLDGNGRIGRLLIIILLIEQEMLPSPLLYLSEFFEATRDDYYKKLYNVSAFGNWNEWLSYFLNGVAIQSEDVLLRSERINNILSEWKFMVAGISSKFSIKIIDLLAANPYCSAKTISDNLGVAFSTAQRGIITLEKLGIIKKINDNKRDKTYCAYKLLEILQEPTKHINSDQKI